MVLYVVGLGLYDENDITLRGLEAVRKCSRVYLEAYTSILMVPDYRQRLERLYGKPVQLAHRETVELESERMLQDAHRLDVAFLVVGDPLSATTHTDLILRARRHSPPIAVEVIHNASIMTAIGASGLQPYNFGQTVSVPFWTSHWRPDSWLERIEENLKLGNHTLVLGDIKVREQSEHDMARGILRYQPPRYMLIPQLIEQLLAASQAHHEKRHGDVQGGGGRGGGGSGGGSGGHCAGGLGVGGSTSETAKPVLSADETLCVALCRMGATGGGGDGGAGEGKVAQRIVSGTLGELLALASPTDEETAAERAAADDDDDEEEALASEAQLEQRRAQRAEARARRAFGEPLHSLVVVGRRLHELEVEYAGSFRVAGSRWFHVARDVYGVATVGEGGE